MRKRILLVFLGVVVVLTIFIQIFSYKPTVTTFELDDYRYYIENYSSEENIGDTANLRKLVKKVENLWIKLYGKSVKNEKPYKIFYDPNNDVWLIQGSLRTNMMGGVANILIENSTGKVLAVWHEK